MEVGHLAVVPLHGRDHRGKVTRQFTGFPGDSTPHTRVRVILVSFPTRQRGPHHPRQAGAVDIKITLKRLPQQIVFLTLGKVRMTVIELELPVRIGQFVFLFILDGTLFRELGMKRRAGQGSVEHELMEVGVMAHCVVDCAMDIFRRMFFETDDRGTENANSVRLQLTNQLLRINSLEFGVLTLLAFQTHPDPGDAETYELFDAVGAQHVGRAKDVERPGLVVLLHQRQQPQRPLAVQEKVFVHDKERSGLHGLL